MSGKRVLRLQSKTILVSVRHSRDEILDLFRVCRAELGSAPGRERLCKLAGLKQSEIDYYWPRYSALVQEGGAEANRLNSKLPDEQVFQSFARICLHLGKIPARTELRLAARELNLTTPRVYDRFGGIGEFDVRFREWLQSSGLELRPILDFPGWRSVRSPNEHDGAEVKENRPAPGLHPFLPQSLQYLDVLARGERPPFEVSTLSPGTLFERRTSDAFRCLGFEISPFGQGTGRNADVLAVAQRERFAVIIDAKVRSGGYILGTEDRKFLEYARSHGADLKRKGSDNIYFVVVGPRFNNTDAKKLIAALSDSPIRSASLVTAAALMRLVEESIRNRSHFSLSDFEHELFANRIISA